MNFGLFRAKQNLHNREVSLRRGLTVCFSDSCNKFEYFLHRDKIKTEQIVKSLNLKISARDSRHTDSRVHLKALFDQWLPLSSSLLTMVIDKLPSPVDVDSERVEKLMCSGLRTFDSLPEKTQTLKDGAFLSGIGGVTTRFSKDFFRYAVVPIFQCAFFFLFLFFSDFLACSSSDDAPVIVFVSKMFAVEDSALPKHRKR